MSQSDELTAFYQAYVEWLGVGAPETVDHPKNPFEFLRGAGLCANLRYFCEKHSCFSRKFQIEMGAQFTEAGLDLCFPFNRFSEDFYREVYKDTCYINPKRVQWVNNHC